MRRAAEARWHPLRRWVPGHADRHGLSLQDEGGPGPAVRGHLRALGVHTVADAAPARGARAVRTDLCWGPHPEPVVGPADRPIGQSLVRQGAYGIPAI